MKRLFSGLLLEATLSVAICVAVGAQPSDSSFHPDAVWSAEASPVPSTDLHSGSGHPGPSYWQNHVDYTIKARLDTSAQKIQGRVTFEYTNNSPSSLSALWLLLGRSASSSLHRQARPRMTVQDLEVKRKKNPSTPSTMLAGSRMQVRLDTPIPAGGGTVTLTLRYAVPLTSEGIPGWTRTRSGILYSVGQWFPRVAAYSDQYGWASSTPWISREPHAEYGSFNYSITVPASLIVAGSGTLMNPGEVLTSDQRRRLMRARDSRQKVAIITPDQAGTPDTRPESSGRLTWRFQMNGVRTVAWAASPAFIWNAAQFFRPGTRNGLAMSFYPRSAMGGNAWNRATYHTQKAVSFFSKKLYAYPWNNAISVTGPQDGKAFPGLSFCPPSATGNALFSCAVEGQSYNWFPGIVGSNPDRHPWMDDGLRSFVSMLAHRRLYDGEFLAHMEGDARTNAQSMGRRLASEQMTPILAPPTPTADGPPQMPTTVKPAFGLHLLREYVLRPDRLDYALRQYVQRWAFHVPEPHDFFRTVEDASGENLSWFWKGWFASNWALDLAVTSVSYPHDTPKDGAEITFSLHRQLPMPVHARVVEKDGDKHHLHLPVEVWRQGDTYVAPLDTDSRLKRVTIDPSKILPDANRSNNTWTSPEL